MKHYSTLFAFLIITTSSVKAQAVFQKTFAGTGNITGTRASSATNGIIIAGTRGTSLSSPEDAVLMKTDLSGTVSWTKTYGGAGNEVFNMVRQTSDGGFIAAGYTNSSGAGGKDALVVKTDASGNVTWSKTYGTVDDEIAFDVIQTSDGGYAFTGDAKKISANTSVGSIYLMKLTSTGTETWSKMWGAGMGNFGYNLIQTSDGGYLVGGRANNGFYSFIKTDGSGNISFARASMAIGLQTVWFSQMIQTSDGGYAVVGSGTTSSNDGVIAFEKLDATCTVQWAKNYNPGSPSLDFGFGLAQSWDGGYCILGYSGNFAPNFNNLYVLNITSTGVVSTAKTTTPIDYGYTVSFATAILSDGTIAATGTTGSSLVLFKADTKGNTGCTYNTASATETTPSYFDNAITNWTSSGTVTTNTASITGTSVTLSPTGLCSGIGIEENETTENISLYPNPAGNEFTIDLSDVSFLNNITIEVYNSIGEIVETKIFPNVSGTINFSSVNYKTGIYFVKLSDGKKSVLKKLIVEK